MSRYSQLQTAQITLALKRANQRIAQLGKTFGKTSSVYKQEAGKFQKGAYKNYVSISSSGNIKFDIRAINKLIRSDGNPSEIDRILAEFAGIKVNPDGEVVPVKGGGVPTLTELEKRTTKKLERWGEDPGDYNKKQLQTITEELAEFSENFQTSYETYMAKFGEAEARKDSTIQLLYGEYRNKRLTYRQLEEIKNKMDSYIANAASEAVTFEEDNTNEL